MSHAMLDTDLIFIGFEMNAITRITGPAFG